MDFKYKLNDRNYTNTLSHIEAIEKKGRDSINIIKSNIENSDSTDVISFCNGWDEVFFNIDSHKEKLFEIKEEIEMAEMNFNHYTEYMENLEDDIHNNEKFTKDHVIEIKSDIETMLKTTPTLLEDVKTELESVLSRISDKIEEPENKVNNRSKHRMKR